MDKTFIIEVDSAGKNFCKRKADLDKLLSEFVGSLYNATDHSKFWKHYVETSLPVSINHVSLRQLLEKNGFRVWLVVIPSTHHTSKVVYNRNKQDKWNGISIWNKFLNKVSAEEE